MYLFNIIKEIYDVSSSTSTEYILSQYLLMHIKDITNMSLTDISIQTGISKSVVSKYFKTITNGNNFVLFKTSLSFELQSIIIDDQVIEKDTLKLINQFESLYKNTLSLHSEELVKQIFESKKIIIWGNSSYKSYFNIFINYLLLHQKNIRFLSNIQLQNHYNEIYELTSNDLLIIFEPNTSLYDYILRMSVSAEIFIDENSIKCPKFFIGKASYSNYQCSTIAIEDTNNIYINNILIEYFVSLLLYDYIQLNKNKD